MDLARVGGTTKWMEALVEGEEDFLGWDRLVEGSLRWIRTDLEETSVVMVGQAGPRTSSLDLEGWVITAGVEEGTLVDETEGMEAVGVGMGGPGGMTIVIVITMEEARTEEGVNTGVGGVVTVRVGEEAVEVVVEDTEPRSTLSLIQT
jgi:hypothetical protein